ncbi:Alpha-1,3-mannosyltransferase [Lachnellula hyalina]|uniref:Alpha-1,3-mannosyltransferase n=1 Tax=Lachnellula hyalina TaxID=1316788 RepID=A0A8H8QW24_9HELO|nr:Alpha-1,3-mannosyltransferase [Lachnellula hyalina]TVY23804.1 Alpha-1,3-mannosyltransferase [Lachnellula hyalina]
MLRFQGLRIANLTRILQAGVVLFAILLFVIHLGLVQTPTFSTPSATDLWSHVKSGNSTAPTTKPAPEMKPGDATLMKEAPLYIEAIMRPEDTTFDRLECPTFNTSRYEYLRDPFRGKTQYNLFSAPKRQFFFALNLHENAPVLPRLLGSIIETIRFLGPDQSALSVIEGRSTDGTYEVMQMLRGPLEEEQIPYYFNSSDKNPEEMDRIQMLADLRNEALEPLIENANEWSNDATVIFLNDVSLCMEDILELVHQRIHLKADMTCAMDWMDEGIETFYDVWVARDIKGDTFFEVSDSGSWDSSQNLFWNNEETLERYVNNKPFQVYACWNGGTAFTARPLLDQKIKFRRSAEGECYMGEPTVFCKEMWHIGYGKIAVIPTVNVEYTDENSRKIKKQKGTVSSNLNGTDDMIVWKGPPEKVKCAPNWYSQSWLPWNETLVKDLS